MPFSSKAQSRLMHAAANDPAVAEKTGVPPSVAQKFVAEGHGKKQSKLPDKRKTNFSLNKEKRGRR
jgi:hypothetical protein